MNLEVIIENLMVSNTDIIKRATNELELALLSSPEAVVGLFNIMAGHVKPENRQLSAMQLNRYLSTSNGYPQLLPEIRAYIKSNIMNLVFKERNALARCAIIRFLGLLVAHESQTDKGWVGEVIQLIFNQCNGTDTATVEIGLFVLAKLADVSPEPFIQRFGDVKNFFAVALFPFEENSTNLSLNMIYNVLEAMNALVPKLRGNKNAEQTYREAIPYIVNIATKFAVQGQVDHLSIALDVLQNMAEFTPELLNQHVHLLLEFAFAVSLNQVHNSEVRMMTLSLVHSIIGKKKKLLMKLKLIDPIMNAVFNIMAAEPESEDPDEFFSDGVEDTMLSAATYLMDEMASVLPSKRFVPPLLNIVEPALQNTADRLRRRSAFIAMAAVCEGCDTVIREKYLGSMMAVLKHGLNDPISSVRSAVLFAIGQFAESFQPEIFDYANEMLPLLMGYVNGILQAEKAGQLIDRKNSERAFYAIETFCESIDEALSPYMEELMGMVMEILSNNYERRTKYLAIVLTETAATSYAESLVPWFNPLMEHFKLLIMPKTGKDADELRLLAIDTLAAIARNTKKQFFQFAQEIMQQCIQWLESTQDIDVRKSLINLCGALFSVVGNNMAPKLPALLHHMTCVMNEGNELFKDPDINLINSPNGEDGSTQYGNNPYLEAKVQVIETISEISESCMQILLPSAENLFTIIFNFLDHGFFDLRTSSINTAKVFTINWIRQDPKAANANQALYMLLLRFEKIIRNDDESKIVMEALDAISDILRELRDVALPTAEVRDLITNCIKSGLTYDYECFNAGEEDQNSDETLMEDDSENDIYVIESVVSILPSLGQSVYPMEFARYFEMFEPLLIGHVKNKADILRALAECYAPLGKNVAAYFVKHYKIMLSASKRQSYKFRHNGVYGLGELIRAGKEIAYNYFPEVLSTLSYALKNENKRIVIDNILSCVARLILTNSAMVPLEQVIPVMLEKLPILADKEESIDVMKSFETLYNERPALMHMFTADVVAIAVQTIALDLSENEDIAKSVIDLLQKVRSVYPNEYDQTIANPELSGLISKAKNQAFKFL